MRDATRLDIYFHDDRALFLIPLYQRKYSWQQKHCQRGGDNGGYWEEISH